MSIEQLYRDYAAETIYLIPDSDEGRLIYLWSDDPAPTEHHVRDEAVEYVRKDIHDAHADMLETRGDELQIMLANVEKERDAALEREQALAAHVGRMKGEWEKKDGHSVSANDKLELLVNLLYGEPCVSLARRDLIKQAEILDMAESAMVNDRDAATLRLNAEQLRQRAQELTP